MTRQVHVTQSGDRRRASLGCQPAAWEDVCVSQSLLVVPPAVGPQVVLVLVLVHVRVSLSLLVVLIDLNFDTSIEVTL